MTYLAGQIFVWIVLTFALAFGLGWWAGRRGRIAPPHSKTSEADDGALEAIALERNDLQARFDRLSQAAGEVEAELEIARSRILALEMDREDRAQDLRDAGSLQTTTITDAVDPFTDPPATLLVAPEGEASDLRQIRGVGKVLEMRLHELGIFHFHQLESLEGYDFNWLAFKLGLSPERLEELDWVGQAGRLAAQSDDDELATMPGVEMPPQDPEAST